MNRSNDFFYFTAAERRSILLLIFACGCIWFVKQFILSPSKFSTSEIDHQFDDEIASFLATKEVTKVPNKEVVPFDINAVTENDLIVMGLSPKVASTWSKYRKAIGGFTHVDQVGKIYGMDQKWFALHAGKLKISAEKRTRPRKPQKVKRIRKPFDPNSTEVTDLRALGFTDHAIKSLIKFREKGGRFHEPSDLSFIYGISAEFYRSIEDLIIIRPIINHDVPDTMLAVTATFHSPAPELESVTIDINTANMYEWQMLNGIGPGYAKRIVRFREALGGFSSIAQVGETYGFPDSIFHKIETYLTWSDIPNKILINEVTRKELAKHPYISSKKASIVINYRENNHNLNDIEDLYKIKIFDTLEVQRLAP